MANSDRVYIALGDMAEPIEAFCAQMGCETKAEAVRLLLRTALASDPIQAATFQARQETVSKMRQWMFGRCRDFLEQIQKEVDELAQ